MLTLKELKTEETAFVTKDRAPLALLSSGALQMHPFAFHPTVTQEVGGQWLSYHCSRERETGTSQPDPLTAPISFPSCYEICKDHLVHNSVLLY